MDASTEDVPIGWDLYFPGEEYNTGDPRYPYIFTMFEWLNEKFDDNELTELDFDLDVPLDWNYLQKELPKEYFQEFLVKPIDMLSCLGLAYFNYMQNFPDIYKNKPLLRDKKIMPRIYGYKPLTPLRNLKSNLIGKFVAISGTVVRAGNIKPLVIQMSFKCVKCETITVCHFPDGKYKYPTKCSGSGCRAKNFLPLHSSAITIDWQQIRVQETMDRKDPGRVPRTIEVELTESLVDTCLPGDNVVIAGQVKVLSTEADKSKNKTSDKALYLIYIHANSVDNQKQLETGKLDVSSKDINGIIAISREPNLFKLIVNSICPSIYGHELIKAGLTLTIFGGSTKPTEAKNSLTVRGNPHMLIVGDPGLGKSQMLTAVNYVVPRGVYVCGSYSSATGLTVSILKESGTGDYSIEAGALVLGDQGVCCIDEFDKMSSEHQALMEAMEQQSISVAKAGIVCNLLARTSIIAAANPIGGHYNRAKTVAENLKMDSALLSRFDLIFIVLDKPDEQRDHLISEHVMMLHEDPVRATSISVTQRAQLSSDHTSSSYLAMNKQESLIERLKVSPREQFEPIHPIMLRKYISYARRHINPKLTAEACTVLQSFFLNLREKHRSVDNTPITTRQLESLIRLSQARARLELREEVTEQDARDVIEIMKQSLLETFEDEFGNIDFRKSTGMSKSKEIKRFIQKLQKLSEQNCKSIFSVDELQQIAHDINLNYGDNFADFISNINQAGYLISKGSKQYKLCLS